MLSRTISTIASKSTRARSVVAVQKAKKSAKAYSTAPNPKVFFDVTIGGKDSGRIVFEVRISMFYVFSNFIVAARPSNKLNRFFKLRNDF